MLNISERLKDEQGEAEEVVAVIAFLVMALMAFIGISVGLWVYNKIQPQTITGAVIERVHTPTVYDESFTLDEHKITQEDEFIFVIDIDSDGQGDSRKTVDRKTFDLYALGEVFEYTP